MRIVIADDTAFQRVLLERAIADLGYEVFEAVDGRETLSAVERVDADILVTDWLMPEIDGTEVCRRLRDRAKRRYVYVIMVTTMEGTSRFLEAMDAGVDDFITKPFEKEQLRARLRVAERILRLMREKAVLQSWIPVCMYCKKARNDQRYWQELDQYILEHTDVRMSHGICPDCLEKRFPDVYQQRLEAGELD